MSKAFCILAIVMVGAWVAFLVYLLTVNIYLFLGVVFLSLLLLTVYFSVK